MLQKKKNEGVKKVAVCMVAVCCVHVQTIQDIAMVAMEGE